MFAEAASVGLSVGEVIAIVASVAGPLATALGVAVKLYIAQVAQNRDDNKTSTAAILAERAVNQATIQPLVDNVGKLAIAVTDLTKVSGEQRDAGNRVQVAVDRQSEAVVKLWEKAVEQQRRTTSSQNIPAVRT